MSGEKLLGRIGENVTGENDEVHEFAGLQRALDVLFMGGIRGIDGVGLYLSILDTEFLCSIVEATTIADVPAVVTEVQGRAWLTGISYYGTDPEDPFPQGYRLNDTWHILSSE